MNKLPIGLKHQQLFASVLGDHADERFDAGERLFFAGQPADHALYITEGRVLVHVTNELGMTVEIAQRGAGDLIGEMSLVTGVRCAEVSALEDVTAVRVSHAEMVQLANSRPDFALALYSLATERLYEANRLLARTSKSTQN